MQANFIFSPSRAIAHLNTFAHNYMLDIISLVRVFYRSLRTI